MINIGSITASGGARGVGILIRPLGEGPGESVWLISEETFDWFKR